MRLTTLKKSEADVSTLAQRLYPNLSESSRKKVETALLKANPHLAETGAFRPGVVITLPDTSEFKPKPGVVGNDPTEEMLGQLKDAVGSYQKDQAKRLDDALADVEGQEEVLKNKEVAAAIKNSSEASELAKELVASLRERQKLLAVEKKVQEEVFSKMMEDLGTLFK